MWEGALRPGLAALQEITDTVGLRRRIGESFELAALPGTTDEDRKKALHFCVVGGGPTGETVSSVRRIHMWSPGATCALLSAHSSHWQKC